MIQREKATQKVTGGGNPAKEEEVVTETSCWEEDAYRSVLFRLSNSNTTMRMQVSSQRASS